MSFFRDYASDWIEISFRELQENICCNLCSMRMTRQSIKLLCDLEVIKRKTNPSRPKTWMYIWLGYPESENYDTRPVN